MNPKLPESLLCSVASFHTPINYIAMWCTYAVHVQERDYSDSQNAIFLLDSLKLVIIYVVEFVLLNKIIILAKLHCCIVFGG